MSGFAKLVDFWRCALDVGEDAGASLSIFWHETKNVRARLGLARHDPSTIYRIRARGGPLHFRDNFGDITNLPNLFYRRVYRPRVTVGDGVILDVGANIGLAAAWFSREYPGRPIHCFEPLEENAAMARRNCPTAVVNTVAVGREPGHVELNVDRDAVMASTIPWERAVSSRRLEVVTLDAYAESNGIDRVAFLKIDTEGMELDVLDGARDVLAMTQVVAMETHGDDRHAGTLERLRTAGLHIDSEEFDGHTGMVFASRVPGGDAISRNRADGAANAWNSGT
jgi:FkbM family methyltransferase